MEAEGEAPGMATKSGGGTGWQWGQCPTEPRRKFNISPMTVHVKSSLENVICPLNADVADRHLSGAAGTAGPGQRGSCLSNFGEI